MRPPHPRFTIRWLMVAVAVSALIAWIGAWVHWACAATGKPAVILAAVVVSASMALLAMRFPLVAIPVLLLIAMLSPPRGFGSHYQVLPLHGAILAWAVGAPTGWARRFLRARGRRQSGPPEPAGPGWVEIRDHIPSPGEGGHVPLGGVEELRL